MMRIDDAVSRADAEALAAIGAEMGGFTLGDFPEILLIWYAGATPRLREVVLKYGPPEISSGKVNALDVLLQGGIQTRGNTKFETLPLPIATSFLPDQKNPTRYAPKSAVDGDPATSWVEGAEGLGVGQKIAVAVPSQGRDETQEQRAAPGRAGNPSSLSGQPVGRHLHIGNPVPRCRGSTAAYPLETSGEPRRKPARRFR
jgi:hypothetical protein